MTFPHSVYLSHALTKIRTSLVDVRMDSGSSSSVFECKLLRGYPQAPSLTLQSSSLLSV